MPPKPLSPSTQQDPEMDELNLGISTVSVNSDAGAEPSSTRSPSSETIATVSARSNDTNVERKSNSSESESEEEEDELDEDDEEEDDDDDDSRNSEDEYSGVESEDSLDASFADDSFLPDSEGSEHDQLDGSEPPSDESEEEDESDNDDRSVDLEWEEAQEMAGMAIRSHRSALKAAAIDGWYVGQDKTILGTVEVVRSLVNTVGAFEDGPVTADIILTHLETYKNFLLSESGDFLFANRRDVINKYLALVKYATDLSADPAMISKSLKEVLSEDAVHDGNGNIDLKALVRLMKQRSAEAQ